MREVKFRGKRLDNGEWVYGDLLHICGGCVIYYGSQTEAEEFEDDGKTALCLSMDEVAPVAPYTVGQFTGCVDRNGKPIYEGDILVCQRVPSVPLEVYYNLSKGTFCFAEHTHTEGALKGTTPIGEVLMTYYPDMCVIGNIHDKKEEE